MAKKRRVPRVATLKSKPLVTDAEVAQARAAKERAATEAANKVENDEKEPSATICLSRIPHGFYEKQMRGYFTQFGKVKRLRLSRSKKSGRSKGYAFVEFEFPEVAKIAAETMDGYLTYQKIMKCKVMDKDKIHEKLWKGADEPFKRPWHRRASKIRHNSLLNANPDRIHSAQKRRVQMERRKNKKLEALGIDFKTDALQSEWTNLKGRVSGPKTPKNNKWKKFQDEKKKGKKRKPGEERSYPIKKAKTGDDADEVNNDATDVGDSFTKMVMEAFEIDEDDDQDKPSSDIDSEDEEEEEEQSSAPKPPEDFIHLPEDESDSEEETNEEGNIIDEEDDSNNEQSSEDEEFLDESEHTERTGTKNTLSSTKQKKKTVLATPKKGKLEATVTSTKKVKSPVSSGKASVKKENNLPVNVKETDQIKSSPALKSSETPGKTPKGVKENKPTKVNPDLKEGKHQKKTPAKTPKKGLNQSDSMSSPDLENKNVKKTPGKTPKSERKVESSKKTPKRVAMSMGSSKSEPRKMKTPGKTPSKRVGSAKKGWKVTTTKSAKK